MCLTSNFHALLFRDEVLGRGGDYFGNVARHRIGALRRIVYICSHWDGYYAPACAGWVTQIINSARTMEEKLQFDPNAPGVDNGNYFGMPFTPQQAELVLLPVPWEVTVSYGGGTARGPEAIRLASLQVDLYEPLFAQGWRRGIATLPADAQLSNRSAALRAVAGEVIAGWEQGVAEPTERMRTCIGLVDQGSQRLNEWVYATACRWLDAGKRVGLIGGDHSVPLGLIRALSERHKGMGVLHIDAHADLRQAYEGFRYSHASIMYNVLEQLPDVARLTQVGVRDFCDDEQRIESENPRIKCFYDYQLSSEMFGGSTWRTLCDRIIDTLPEQVYVSFDIDGLDPGLCPHTGTPVPGGLRFDEAVYLLMRLRESGRQLIGFDLCEVAPSASDDDQWDANVGARILYKLCNLLLRC